MAIPFDTNKNVMESEEDRSFKEPIFIEKFDDSEPDNEVEEDIVDLEKLDLSTMAVTGTDWTTETLISQLEKGNIILNPDFQRRDAWTQKTKSRFIESLLLGLPIPQIILAEVKGKRGVYFVIDGKQRLLSLSQFVLGNKAENTEKLILSKLEVKKQFNGKSYDDILNSPDNDEITAFNNQTIRTIVIKHWPSTQALYLLFLRLNTGSVKLSPQELRQAMFPGEFIRFANETSAQSPMIKKMLNLRMPDFRMRDVEILIRYYAFRLFISEYTGSLQAFLDMTCDRLNKGWDQNIALIKNEYSRLEHAIEQTLEIFGDDAFKKYKNGRYEKKYNRAVIDIMTYFFAQDLNSDVLKSRSGQIKKEFELLCDNDQEFLAALETTTKSVSAVKKRFGEWGSKLNEIVGDESVLLPSWK